MNTNDEYKNEESASTQCNKILDYLKKGFTITSLEALNMFGCLRLASVSPTCANVARTSPLRE